MSAGLQASCIFTQAEQISAPESVKERSWNTQKPILLPLGPGLTRPNPNKTGLPVFELQASLPPSHPLDLAGPVSGGKQGLPVGCTRWEKIRGQGGRALQKFCGENCSIVRAEPRKICQI
ncbi:hypothetical protein PoB_007661600 [Plakobranchus ocellatus]|uniref:Uncharacterized protein n=1 Tax=Plakobranchus ocellatus TaxID=259542 RepID=A0AAV4E228_9GAST|nr:hypothetical protein PoB_007661600 [Plakobranchus ocellatus]